MELKAFPAVHVHFVMTEKIILKTYKESSNQDKRQAEAKLTLLSQLETNKYESPHHNPRS